MLNKFFIILFITVSLIACKEERGTGSADPTGGLNNGQIRGGGPAGDFTGFQGRTFVKSVYATPPTKPVQANPSPMVVPSTTYTPHDIFVLDPPAKSPWKTGYRTIASFTDTSNFTPLTHNSTLENPAQIVYRAKGRSADDLPMIYYNNTELKKVFGTPFANPFSFNQHPGANGDFSVLRFVVPCEGFYTINASWEAADIFHGGTDAHIVVNGVSLYDGIVNLTSPASYTSAALSLKTDDLIEFILGYGPNKTYSYDNTKVTPIISSATQCP